MRQVRRPSQPTFMGLIAAAEWQAPLRFALLLLIIMLTVVARPASSEEPGEHWSAQGTVEASVGGNCALAPTCLAFLAEGISQGSCPTSRSAPNGIEISITQLPVRAAGTEATFAWNSGANALGGITIGWIGDIGGTCQDLGSVVLQPDSSWPLFSYGSDHVVVDPDARFIYVGAERGIDLSWSIWG